MLDTTTTAPQTTVPTVTDARRVYWLLIATVVLTIVALGAATWQIVTDDDVQEPDRVSGFEYSTEATTGRLAGPGVTTQYLGHSGELYPETDLGTGFDLDDDTTVARAVSPGITTPYFGNSGELFPEPDGLSGFDDDQQATPGRTVTDRVVTQYFGNSGELDPEK